MTRSERELIIQRYLSGGMTSAEEGDFFIQVALDRELRHDLQAQQTIESAFRKEREMERTGHTALRTRVASMLTAGTVPQEQRVSVEAPEPSGASAPLPEPAPSFAPPVEAAPRGGLTPTGWGALAACTLALVIAVLMLVDPFGPASVAPPAPETLPGRQSSDPSSLWKEISPSAAPGSARSGDAGLDGADTPREGGSAGAQSQASSPTASPREPRRSAAAVRRGGALPHDAASERVHDPAVRSAASPHDAAADEGVRQEKKGEKIKVGVKVRITPRQ